MTILIFLIIAILLSTIVCYFVARSKNLNVQYWVLAGCLLGPFAIPFIFLANSKAKNESNGI